LTTSDRARSQKMMAKTRRQEESPSTTMRGKARPSEGEGQKHKKGNRAGLITINEKKISTSQHMKHDREFAPAAR